MYQFITFIKFVLKANLFVPCVHVHFLGADGLADVFDVVLSTVVENIFVLFPEVKHNKRENTMKVCQVMMTPNLLRNVIDIN